jgi:hypothetical protein
MEKLFGVGFSIFSVYILYLGFFLKTPNPIIGVLILSLLIMDALIYRKKSKSVNFKLSIYVAFLLFCVAISYVMMKVNSSDCKDLFKEDKPFLFTLLVVLLVSIYVLNTFYHKNKN